MKEALVSGVKKMEFDRQMVRELRKAKRVAVLTGAGVSEPSGIPTFRDAMRGLWAKYDPMQLATPEAFERDPVLVSKWYDQRRVAVLKCEPNDAHRAIVQWEREMEELGRKFVLLTQNVDRLHQRAGSKRVEELHGSLIVWRNERGGEEEVVMDEAVEMKDYPMVSGDGGLMRPGVVWFGEMLPEQALRGAEIAAAECDVFMSVGTSGIVYPAAGFLDEAKRHGAVTIEVNVQRTPASEKVDYMLEGGCDVVLPGLMEEVWG